MKTKVPVASGKRSRPDLPLLAALALLSAAVTAQQIALLQILSWTHWHHFAYMIVAIALLGFGIAGSILALGRGSLFAGGHAWLPWLLILTAISIPLGISLAQRDALALDLPLLFFDPGKNAWRLAALCLLMLPPFLCGGLATGLILITHARCAGRYYAASLAGAGLGGLIGLVFVARLAPPRLAPAVALIALTGAICLVLQPLFDRRQPGSDVNLHRLSGGQLFGVLAAGLYLVVAWQWPAGLRASEFKPIRRTLDLPDARIIVSRPSVHGWIQIVDAPALRPAPAVSLEYQGEIPPQREVFSNGLAYGSLLDAAATQNPRWLEFTTDAVAFLPRSPRRVLLLESGPGGWAALAVARGATRVIVVEPNRTLVDLLASSEHPLAPEWRLPSVELVPSTGRTHLRRTKQEFDLIRFPTVGALGGTAGLASTSEQFLLTREAFIDAWRHLAPDGMIAVTAWLDFPERNPLRLLATLVATIESAGLPPRSHLVAVRSWASVTFLLRRSPWSAAAESQLRQFCAERGFDPLLLPNLRSDERESNNAWQNPHFFQLVDRLVDGPREAVDRDQPFLLRPTTDDRPYFSQFFRWSTWQRVARSFGTRTVPFYELGSLTVALTLCILSGLALVGIVLPLTRLGWHSSGKAAVLLYFGGLGAGFMLVELGLMLWAHAWLGSPILGAAVMLTALLISSGAGSLWSERRIAAWREQRRAIVTIIVAIGCVALLVPALLATTRGWPLGGQLTVLLGLVAPLGFAMGLAFPLGLRRLETIEPRHLPWAWAVNGCTSVVAPSAAMLIAMLAGFSAVLFIAAGAYAVALLGAGLTRDSTKS